MGRNFDNQCAVGTTGGGGSQRHQFGKELSLIERVNRVEFWISRFNCGLRDKFGGGRDDRSLRGGRLLHDADFKAAIYKIGGIAMGVGYDLVCQKCGYSFEAWLGIGRMYPAVYEETVQKGKRGELGEELQKFLLENPSGAIDISCVVGACKKCGELHNIDDLSMYLPKKGLKPDKPKGRWSVSMPFEGAEYVSPMDLKAHYELVAKYPHKCKHCGGEIKIFTEKTIGRIKCPHCHEKLVKGDKLIMWD